MQSSTLGLPLRERPVSTSKNVLKWAAQEADLIREIDLFRKGKTDFSKLYSIASDLFSSVFSSFKISYPEMEFDDARQECMIRLYKILQKKDLEISNIRYFIYKCFNNLLINESVYVRRDRRSIDFVDVSDLDELESPEKKDYFEDLVIDVKTRFKSFFAVYTINRVLSVMVYGGLSRWRKGALINSLILMSGKDRKTVAFMVDYSSVVIRHRIMKGIKNCTRSMN